MNFSSIAPTAARPRRSQSVLCSPGKDSYKKPAPPPARDLLPPPARPLPHCSLSLSASSHAARLSRSIYPARGPPARPRAP
ncbi:hypothetical protein NL676_013521 [Syzygium grande]|nr:hypothetical protein NL676_013521 [Syzygium grande]